MGRPTQSSNFKRCYAAENPDKYVYVVVQLSCWRVWYDVRLHNLVAISVSHQCTYHMHKGRPTSMTLSPLKNDQLATSINMYMSISTCEEKTVVAT